MFGKFSIPVGRNHVQEPINPVRTEEQRLAVYSITKSEHFDFACNNPFPADLGTYKKSFVFLYYTTDGVLHAARITASGRVRYEVTVDENGTTTSSAQTTRAR